MEIKGLGVAGTMESSDIMITLEPPSTPGIVIDLNSTVYKRYGRIIREVIVETLRSLGIDGAAVKAVDKGALDCTIRARVLAAACRACRIERYDWEGGR